LTDLKNFCKQHKIKLKIYSYKQEFGNSLDNMLKQVDVVSCTLCGTFRRYLLNKMSKGYKKIATGHNLDDEVQSILMNLLKNNVDFCARLGPRSGVVEDINFVPRIKPLYFCTEKEVMAYSLLMGFDINFTECPYAHESFRAQVRDLLNEYEVKHPSTKINIIKNFLKKLPKLKKSYVKNYDKSHPVNVCKVCREPSYRELCKTCQFVESLKSSKYKKSRIKKKASKHLIAQWHILKS
jgi:uncharacterized protein (TIGR00269 family)